MWQIIGIILQKDCHWCIQSQQLQVLLVWMFAIKKVTWWHPRVGATWLMNKNERSVSGNINPDRSCPRNGGSIAATCGEKAGGPESIELFQPHKFKTLELLFKFHPRRPSEEHESIRKTERNKDGSQRKCRSYDAENVSLFCTVCLSKKKHKCLYWRMSGLKAHSSES